MIEVMPKSSGNVMGIHMSERLTDSDYKGTWSPKLDELLKKSRNVRLLVYMDEGFKGWDAEAMWDDTKFGLTHIGDIGHLEKVAMVGAPGWCAMLSSLVGYLIPGKYQAFPDDKVGDAWTWAAA